MWVYWAHVTRIDVYTIFPSVSWDIFLLGCNKSNVHIIMIEFFQQFLQVPSGDIPRWKIDFPQVWSMKEQIFQGSQTQLGLRLKWFVRI